VILLRLVTITHDAKSPRDRGGSSWLQDQRAIWIVLAARREATPGHAGTLDYRTPARADVSVE
jgi:hypothetical protein